MSLNELVKARKHMIRRRKRKLNRAMNRREKREEIRKELQQMRVHLDHLEELIAEEEDQAEPNTRRLKRLADEFDETVQETHELAEEKERLAKPIEKFTRQYRRAKAAAKRLGKRIVKRRQRTSAGEVFDQGDWGARVRSGFTDNQPISFRVLHHTAYPALSASASVSQECAKMRTIEAGHIARGFTGVGYHAVVFPSGRIYLARPKGKIGAHTLGKNTGSVGVSNDGNYEVSSPTSAQVAASKKAFALVGGNGRLYGHYQLGPTACPGKNLKPKLDEIA